MAIDPKKILAVVEAGSVTGPAKNLLEFCRTASGPGPKKNPLSISLVTFHRRGAPASEFVAAARELSIPVHVIEERFRFDPRARAELRNVIRSVAPEIIQTHSVKSHFLIRTLGLRPWIAFHHGYTATDLKMLAYNQLDRWSLPSADAVVTVSEAFRSQVIRVGVDRENVRVIPNAIEAPTPDDDGASPSHSKKQVGLEPDDRLILTVGRLSREKDQATLVHAFAHALKLRADLRLRLIIAGDGPERKNLERTAEDLGIGSQVTFAGQLRDVSPYYRAADVFVLPSRSEGSPNVLLEAMVYSVPIVATAVGGIPEMVSNEESALLVQAGDSIGLANMIIRILEDQSLSARLTSKAKTLLSDRYSPSRRFRAVTDLYDEVIRRGPRPQAFQLTPASETCAIPNK